MGLLLKRCLVSWPQSRGAMRVLILQLRGFGLMRAAHQKCLERVTLVRRPNSVLQRGPVSRSNRRTAVQYVVRQVAARRRASSPRLRQ